jgi:hypothetical protein
MSTIKKLRNQGSELTRLKKLWRDSLAEDAREFWRQQFISELSQAEIRKLIHARLKVNLTYDGQLNAFRDWELEQRSMDLEAERAEEEERRLIEDHPNWTKDQVRDELIKRFYARALAQGNAKLGLATMDRDLNERSAKTKAEQKEKEIDLRKQKLGLDSRKIALLEKKAAQLDQVKEVVAARLSPEEQKKRLKEILK